MAVTRNVALFNLIVQLVLIAGVSIGAYLALTRRFSRHCLLMRTLMGAQLLLIGVIMAPQMVRYLQNWGGFSTFTTVLVIHHALGLIAFLLWVYINLAMLKVVKGPRRYTWFMRSALVAWVSSLALGIYVFWYLWL